MAKKFKIANNGDLIVTVNNSNTVFIPNGEVKEDVGNYAQTTIQTIKKNKIKVLKKFIENEKVNAEKQLETLNKQLNPIKDLQDIDEKIVKQCIIAINKGNKAFKDSMKVLQQRIVNLDNKKKIIIQIEYISKQLTEVKSDLDNLNKVFK